MQIIILQVMPAASELTPYGIMMFQQTILKTLRKLEIANNERYHF